MWNVFFGYFFGRATGIARFVRVLLLIALIGLLCAAVIYAGTFFNAVRAKDEMRHVQPHHSR